jgi:outer membrane receptor protein involved in Fe transport
MGNGDEDRARTRNKIAILAGVSLVAVGAAQANARDEAASATAPAVALQEIVVTAQKREESVNTVPMSITAVTGPALAERGVIQPRDLVKVTPGFGYADSYVGSPIYTLRGIGFSDISLGGRPTVSLYSDEAPIPFAIETRGADLDLARVEILKGPQGTLFGQNATGGAINFIDAKPTQTFQAGADASYGSFDSIDLGGFVSGPLSRTLAVRLAVDHTQNGPWQKSYTTGAGAGAGDFTNARLILAWAPVDPLKVALNLNGWIDRSDTQAAQAIAIQPSVPPLAPAVPGLLAYPLTPANDRAADFNPGLDYARDNHFVQANLRIDYRPVGTLNLTSLSSYSRYSENQLEDIDGTTLSNLSQKTFGEIESYYQELRLAGPAFNHGHFIAGASYAKDTVLETDFDYFPQSTNALVFTGLGLPVLADLKDLDDQWFQTAAVFANVDDNVTPTIKLHAGARFTEADDRFRGCTADSGDGIGAADFGPFQNAIRASLGLPPNPPIKPGQCVTANAAFTPGLVAAKLNQNNVSWRFGGEWTGLERTLIYANASRGFKAGGFPDLGASAASQFAPASQESVTAYEVGFKSTLLARTLQLNGAVFHYDYENKQILGHELDPVFGALLKLVNVPRSQVTGAELQMAWAPTRGLSINAGGSFIDSHVLDHFTNYDANGRLVDFNGEAFPNTPKWTLTSDISYQRPLRSGLEAFVGGGVTYQSRTNSQLGNDPLLATRAYALIDLRAGVGSADGTWKLTVWARNVGDVYYWTTANRDLDTVTRYAGMPRTVGVSLSYRCQ